jgi:hypothetical protein
MQMERLAVSLGQEELCTDVSSSNVDSLAVLESPALISTTLGWHCYPAEVCYDRGDILSVAVCHKIRREWGTVHYNTKL